VTLVLLKVMDIKVEISARYAFDRDHGIFATDLSNWTRVALKQVSNKRESKALRDVADD
jgi:hypothetical protein